MAGLDVNGDHIRVEHPVGLGDNTLKLKVCGGSQASDYEVYTEFVAEVYGKLLVAAHVHSLSVRLYGVLDNLDPDVHRKETGCLVAVVSDCNYHFVK